MIYVLALNVLKYISVFFAGQGLTHQLGRCVDLQQQWEHWTLYGIL